MIKLKFFERSDIQQLINWIETPEFLLQWGGPNFSFPLTEQQVRITLKMRTMIILKLWFTVL